MAGAWAIHGMECSYLGECAPAYLWPIPVKKCS